MNKMAPVQGIDVSAWQGKISWPVVKCSGVKFAILKAGGSDKGFYKDSTFEANYASAKIAGMPVGAYYFAGPYFYGKEAGEADAKRFLEQLKGKQFEYPVYIDVEKTAYKRKEEATDAVIAFCEMMEKAGYYVGVYASDVSGFKLRLNLERLKDYDLWVAKYSSTPPSYVKTYGMWQYTSKSKVNGIIGNVDHNYAYKNYPSIIKKAKLNGFNEVKENVTVEPVKKPEPVSKPEPVVNTTKTTYKATEPARNYDKYKQGRYICTGNLNMRTGAGVSKKIMTTIPKCTVVSNYGYFTTVSKTRWMYVLYKASNGDVYEGFCSEKYLKRI